MDIQPILSSIQNAKSLILTTHKQCDGDGLGSSLGFYYAMKKANKSVRLFTVDEIPRKYRFLDHGGEIERYDKPHLPIQPTDLALIFDTNDQRLVEPLYSELKKKCKEIIFIDHHPVLNQGPGPTTGSFINTKAASTGEMTYFIIKKLNLSLNQKIARALYTSIVFDTQLFRYIKGSPQSHKVCADLLLYENNPEEVHKFLFSTFTRGKIKLLAKVFSELEFYAEGQIALSLLRSKDLKDFQLNMDDSRDVIDIIMDIESVVLAVLFRQDSDEDYKISLRSRQGIEVLSVAEKFYGGGHPVAAGASLKGKYPVLKKRILDQLLLKFPKAK